MEYTLQIHNREYELPKKTLAVEEKIEKIKKLCRDSKITTRTQYENKLNFITEMVGEDNAKEIFESNNISNIAEMDLGEIDATYRGVLDGFARPDREAVAKENLKVLGNPMIQQMLSIAEGMDKLQGALKEND